VRNKIRHKTALRKQTDTVSTVTVNDVVFSSPIYGFRRQLASIADRCGIFVAFIFCRSCDAAVVLVAVWHFRRWRRLYKLLPATAAA